MTNSLQDDLDRAVALLEPIAEELRGARIFMTGGTGFVGCWMLETMLAMNRQLDTCMESTVTTRDEVAFMNKARHLYDAEEVVLLEHPLEEVLPYYPFTHVIHAEPTASSKLAIDFAVASGAKKLLFTSSGSIYGKRYRGERLTEDCKGLDGPADTSDYGRDKAISEMNFTDINCQCRVEAKIARMFTFVGPYLPLDKNFAVGNFIGDVLAGRKVAVTGDGTPCRSYLYGMDMAVWLWTILVKGKSGRAYNVGSEVALTVEQLAAHVALHSEATTDGEQPWTVAQPPVAGAQPHWYVPDTRRARTELGLDEWTPLPRSISKTLAWHKSMKNK